VTLVNADMGQSLEHKQDFDMKVMERERYLLKTSGCNDCHAAGYMQVEGKISEDLWLMGDTFGWRGSWGTTYGTNLRLFADQVTQANG